jgi:hypothetical protein
MNRFLLRVLLFLSPVLGLMVFFVVADPFGLYGWSWAAHTAAADGCTDCRTMRAYDEYRSRWRYNTFLLGNSKTMAILSSDWFEHIGIQRFFKLGTPGESVLNMRRKLEYVASTGASVEHVILLVDNKVLQNVENTHPHFEGPVYMKSLCSSDLFAVEQLAQGFRYYLADAYFLEHWLHLFKTWRGRSSGSIENDIADRNSPFTNEVIRTDMEERLQRDTAAYLVALPTPRLAAGPSAVSLHPRDRVHLRAIRDLLVRSGSDHHVIFGPEYNCAAIPADIVAEFVEIFGWEHVHDFSADTAFCGKPVLYYEANHYRPVVGRAMLEQVYGDSLR